MNALTVCVDYADILRITLSYNLHHFERVLIVTSPQDAETQHVAKEGGAEVFCTDAFWRGGAAFNKWLSLEEGLNELGRKGWICLLDADILLPKEATFPWEFGTLFTPHRCMYPELRLIPEEEWDRYPIHRNVNEHAGYCQVFHSLDPVLGPPPWHDVTWRHAGGADSLFQRKWSPVMKRRPQWSCLHLGEAGVNWAGRGKREELQRIREEKRHKLS